MSRTPFNARITPPDMGSATYTVPAGKIAIFNTFSVPRTDSFIWAGSPPAIKLLYNGVDVCGLRFSTLNRAGPFVFNAGDIIGNGGNDGAFAETWPFGVSGFLYDQTDNPRKVAFNRLLTQSSSYTVPSGKHIVVACYAAHDSEPIIKVNGTSIAYLWVEGVQGFSTRAGPIVAAATNVVSIVPSLGGTTAKTFLSGFLYNNN
jgi:hypothetical protein